MAEESCLQQPQEGLVENFESSVGAAVCMWEKKEATSPLLFEDSSRNEEGEEPQKPIIQPNPIDLDPNVTAQPQNSPLPVYILPTPAANPKPAAPAPKTHASPSLLVQHFKRLMATVYVTPRIPARPDWRIRTGFRDARLRTRTLDLIFFLKQNWYLWVWPTSYNRVKISYTFTESHLHIQN